MLSESWRSVGLGAFLALAVTGCREPTESNDGGLIWGGDDYDGYPNCSPTCTSTTPTCTSANVCKCTASPSSCLAGQVCNSSGVCAPIPPCIGVTCNTGETCELTTGLCRCTGTPAQGTCAAGLVCSATNRCVDPLDPCKDKVCSDATFPACRFGNSVVTCVCAGASCGASKRCTLDGTCKDPDVPCTPACSGDKPACLAGDCKCTSTSCAAMWVCNATTGACEPNVECWHSTNCAGKECGDDGCAQPVLCGTCPDGKTCNGATQMCVDIPPCANPTCKADEWCDHSRSTDCATDNCCAKICNDPAGCLATQVCVLDPADAGTAYTGTCQP